MWVGIERVIARIAQLDQANFYFSSQCLCISTQRIELGAACIFTVQLSHVAAELLLVQDVTMVE